MNNVNLINIQRFSLHDGPGIRTTVFFKGCNMFCPWCANPESQGTKKDLMYFKNKCVICGNCVRACPKQAIELSDDGIRLLREKCDRCGICAESCLWDALQISGEIMPIDDIVNTVLKDKGYYDETGGGVTISGGEPLLQADSVKSLLKKCKLHGLHTAIETTGNISPEIFKGCIENADLFLFDMKHNNAEILRATTGGNLKFITENLRLATQADKEVVVRIPVIPNYNINILKEIFNLANLCGASNIELLPYHLLGKNKYENLGRQYLYNTEATPVKKDELTEYISLGKKMNLNIKI